MKPSLKIIALALTLALLLPLAGCWNYKEIERATIVAGVAIDKGTGGYKYHVSYEALSFSNETEHSVESIIIESDGDTIFEAIRKAIRTADEKLYFSNCNLLIISKDLAKEGVAPLIDFFLRDSETRITIMLVVSGESTAKEVLSARIKTKEPAAFRIHNMLEQSGNALGQFRAMQLFEIYNALTSPGDALTLPSVTLARQGDGETPKLSENAVFKGDKLLGYMPVEDNLFYMILSNEMKSGILLVDLPGAAGSVALEISKCDAQIEPIIAQGGVKIHITIDINADIGEENSPREDYAAYGAGFGKIESAAEDTLRRGVTRLIYDVQRSFDADIFGFGVRIRQSDCDYWKRIEPNWDAEFASLECDVEANVKLFGSGVAYAKAGG